MSEDANNEVILDECRTIAENCLYTAQAHFVMVEKAKRSRFWLLFLPSSIAALAGILTAVGLPGWIGAFAALAGIVTGIATFCGVDHKETAHKTAANLLTCLRHEARAIWETYWRDMSHEQLVAEVRRLGDRFNTLCQALETTDVASYEEARKRIKSGTFVPDFREKKES